MGVKGLYLVMKKWVDDIHQHYIRMWNVPEGRGISTLSKLSLKSGDHVQNKNLVRLLRSWQ